MRYSSTGVAAAKSGGLPFFVLGNRIDVYYRLWHSGKRSLSFLRLRLPAAGETGIGLLFVDRRRLWMSIIRL